MRRIIKFIFWRNSRFEFLFIQDKRAIVRLLLCLLFASIVSVEWPVVGRPAWCHILGEKKVSTLSPNPLMPPRNNSEDMPCNVKIIALTDASSFLSVIVASYFGF